MTSIENILFYYNCLEEKNASKAVLRSILPWLSRLGGMGIQELAAACYTSPSTISRIVRDLGFQDYREFRSSVENCVKQYAFHNRFCAELPASEAGILPLIAGHLDRLAREYRDRVRFEQLDPIVNAMHQARGVYIFGYGILFFESVLQSDLVLSGKPCEIVCGDHAQLRQAAALTPEDFALFLWPESLSGMEPIRNTVRAAKDSGAKLCMLSCSEHPTSFCQADYLITYPGTMHMVDSYYLEFLLTSLDMLYRARFLDTPGP